MQFSRKDIGYTIYSRLERAIREWIKERFLVFGPDWPSHIPEGVLTKALGRLDVASIQEVEDMAYILEETDFPDLGEIVCFGQNPSVFLPPESFTQKEFQEQMAVLYELRCRIAHVKQSFTAVSLDQLMEKSTAFLQLLGSHASELAETLEVLNTAPEKVIVQMPSYFVITDEPPALYFHNLEPLDYESDGGFVGRADDLKKLRVLVLGDLDRVITVSGAGGVGKTALVHRFCSSLLTQHSQHFDAIVWISAKEEKLTLTGIEPIEPSVRNYEEVLDKILEVYGWYNVMQQDLAEKESYVNLILRESDKGILLVVDNLETVQDERILEFVKDMPRPNKALITSRMGLGEVERRYPLKEMSKADAIMLLRIVAKEKGADTLATLPDSVLYNYARRMSAYPLAIKWVVGQVALGMDIERLVSSLASTSGDIARFCFEHIYENVLSPEAKTVLCSLAANDGPLTRGVLTHVSGLLSDNLDRALRDLALASLVVPQQEKGKDSSIVTKYSLLPLTLGYLRVKLQSQPELWRTIRDRIAVVSNRMEEAARAGRQYRYALQDLGATTDEERIAATWALTAYQHAQTGDYDGAVLLFKRAVEIAPNFSRLYRNWAVVETDNGHYTRANELMEKATRLSPDDPALWFTWAQSEKRAGRLDSARKRLQKALALSPNDGAVLGGLGDVEKRCGNHEEADLYLQKALNVPPEMRTYRHEVIAHTAIADNLRRWAEVLLKDKQLGAAIQKAEKAYEHASIAAHMAESDRRAAETVQETALTLGKLLLDTDGLAAAFPILEMAVVGRPTSVKSKKITSLACYHLARSFLESAQKAQAEEYFRLGYRLLITRTDRLARQYDALRAELFDRRITGRLLRVVPGKGYGFIERDDVPEQMVFVHVRDVVPLMSNGDFESLEGIRVSFFIEKTEKGPEARRVTITP